MLDLLIVVFVVGHDLESASGLENALCLFEKRSLNESSFVMTFLWPGIGKVNVNS